MLISRGGGADPLPFTNAPQTCHTAYASDKESVLHQAMLHIAVYCQPCEKCATALDCLLVLLQSLDPAEADKFCRNLTTDSTWEHLGENAALAVERKKLVSDALEGHKSLQRFCQVSVAKCLSWKLDKRLDELPIPNKLMIFPWDKDTSKSSEGGSSLPSSISVSPEHKVKAQDSESDIWDDKITEPEITLYHQVQNAKSSIDGKPDAAGAHDTKNDLNNTGEYETENDTGNQTDNTKHTGQHWDEEFGVQSLSEADFSCVKSQSDTNVKEMSHSDGKTDFQITKNDEHVPNEDNDDLETKSNEHVMQNADFNNVNQVVGSREAKNKHLEGIEGHEYSDNSISISETSRSTSPISRNDIKLDTDVENTTNRYEYEDSDNEEKVITNTNTKKTGTEEIKEETNEDDEDVKSDDTNSVD